MNNTKRKAYRRYKGVAIYMLKEVVAGSDFKVNENGTISNTAPAYDVYFVLADGDLKCDSLDEIKADIDNMLENAKKLGLPIDMMVDTLNEE